MQKHTLPVCQSILLTGPPLPSHLSYGCHWLQTELDMMRCVLNNGLAAPYGPPPTSYWDWFAVGTELK